MIEVVALLTFQGAALVMARSKGRDYFVCLGGKREEGESDVQCLVREIREETGSKLDPRSLSFFGQFEGPHPDPNNSERVRITCYTSETFDCHILSIRPHGEVEEIRALNRIGGEQTTTLGRMIMAECEARGFI